MQKNEYSSTFLEQKHDICWVNTTKTNPDHGAIKFQFYLNLSHIQVSVETQVDTFDEIL